MLHMTKLTLITAVVVAALSAPASGYARVLGANPDQQVATAQPVASSSKTSAPTVLPNPDEQVLAAPTTGSSPASTTNRHSLPAPASQSVVRLTAPRDGFRWGDAGIGAAAMLGLGMLGLIGLSAISQRRERRPRSQASGG